MVLNWKVLIAQACLTLCHPMDCSLPSSSVRGILQARVLMGSHFVLQGIFATQGLNPGRLHCRRILYHVKPNSYQQFLYVELFFTLPLWLIFQYFLSSTIPLPNIASSAPQYSTPAPGCKASRVGFQQEPLKGFPFDQNFRLRNGVPFIKL